MNKEYLPGVYLYGGMAVLMLFVAHLVAGGTAGVMLAAACAGASYGASLAGLNYYDKLNEVLWGLACLLGVLSFLLLLV